MNFDGRIIVVFMSEFNMKKILLLMLIFAICISETLAYSIKVYDEYGNRVGTYRKEGENYAFYDFNDKKVEQPETIIKEAPSQKTLTEYSRTYYDSNMMPAGTYRSGLYGNNGRYYPRGVFNPYPWYPHRNPYMVCPRANNYNINNSDKVYDVVDTRFPKFHKFK